MGTAIRVAPRWCIVPLDGVVGEGEIPLRLASGPGFGDGRHPTTQLCLQAVSALSPRGRSFRMLDFGSGSGVLSIAAARLGGAVEAIEIDEQAIAHAQANLAANGVEGSVTQRTSLAGVGGGFDLVVANILRSVLLAFAGPLVERLAPTGTLVLSGLVGTDVPEVSVRYARLLGGARPEIYERDDWRALVWRPGPAGGRA